MSTAEETLNSQESELLEAALSTAFQPTDIRTVKISSSLAAPRADEAEESASDASNITSLSSSIVSDDSWKSEYDSHLASWRALSAEQREKAEKERARWEALRAQEGNAYDLDEILGPPNPLFTSTSSTSRIGSSITQTHAGTSSLGAPSTPSPADGRGMTSRERPGGQGVQVLENLIPTATGPQPPQAAFELPSHPTTHNRATTIDDGTKTPASQKWEDVHAPSSDELNLSYPDLSFSSTSPPHPQDDRGARTTGTADDDDEPAPSRPAPPPSATLTVFNPSVSWRTRSLALLSSIAINMFLPFINGMMLGFGEIAAKNIVVWVGWRVPGGAATAVGVGSVPRSKRAQEDRENVQRQQ